MITDLRVLMLADGLLLDVPAERLRDVRDRFETFIITEDVVVEDVTETFHKVALHGPAAATAVARALGTALVAETSDVLEQPAFREPLVQRLMRLEEHASIRLQVRPEAAEVSSTEAPRRSSFIIVGSRELGRADFHIYASAEAVAWLRPRLLDAGAVAGDAATWEVLRVESGLPLFGRDMDTDTIPLEAGIQDRAISLTKGCYVGQEIIVRVLHRGHGRVARRLVGMARIPAAEPGSDEQASDPVVTPGDLLFQQNGEREIGRITSAVFSPALRQLLALGYVQRDYVEPGSHVIVRHGSQHVPMVVAELPFVR
jgi:folate-binding protein YgfZ